MLTPPSVGTHQRQLGLLWTKILLYSLLTSLALSVEYLPAQGASGPIRLEIQGGSIVFFVLFCALVPAYRFLLSSACVLLPSAALVSIFFSLFLLFGTCFEAADSAAPIFSSPSCLVLAGVMILGYFLFFYSLTAALFRWLDSRCLPECSSLSPAQRRRFFLISFGIILLGWLPYLILCYPGSVTYDGLYQLGQFSGQAPATNHHPWLSTLLMGWIVGLGGDNPARGVFFYVMFQSLVCTAALAGVCWQIRLLAGRTAALLSLAFFTLVPTFGGYAQMFVKDTLFYGIFAVFFLLAVEFLRRRGVCHPVIWAALLLTGVLCALLRNNGLYLVVPTLLCLAFVPRALSRRVGIAGVGVGVLALYLCFNQLCLPALGVEPGSVREMLSLPFQQTARYVRTYSQELTEEEIAVIDRVLDYESLFTAYDPRVSDGVKNTYHGDSEALKDYLALWVRQGLRHPGVYLEAAWNAMFGYFLPGYRYGPFGGNYFFMQEPNYGMEFEFLRPNGANLMDQFSRLWSRLPGLGLLNAPATFSWLLILCTAALLRRRRWRALIAALPLWLALAICCVSPVNGLVRYMLPSMAATPLLMAYTLYVLTPNSQGGFHG